MKQLQTTLLLAFALLIHSPSWAGTSERLIAATFQEQAPTTHGDKLAVSGALFRDDFMITSFADTVADGETLHLQPKITSSYISKVIPDGEKLRLIPATYEHGYDLKITPHTLSTGVVSIAVRVEGSEVLDFVRPEERVGGIGSPQTLLTGLDSKLLASIGKESHADWGCNTSSEGSSQASPCRYNLILTVDKDSGQ